MGVVVSSIMCSQVKDVYFWGLPQQWFDVIFRLMVGLLG